MKSIPNNNMASLAMETTVRMTAITGQGLFGHMRTNPHCEQMGFGFGHHTQTAGGTTILVRELLLPDRTDFAEQTIAGVCPTRDFHSYLYSSALRTSSTIIEFHTHPGSIAPIFSDIDHFHALRNAQYIAHKFPEPVTLVLIVANNSFDAFDGAIYDRRRGEFCQLSRLEVLGRPTRIWTMPEVAPQRVEADSPEFDRQQRIPGWSQQGIEEQRIGIVGVGGNGAPLLQTLLSIGAGRRGFIAYADHDLVEKSNLPRLPYACEQQVGTPKVVAATQYASRKSPTTTVYPFPCRFHDRAVMERFKMATVLFYCGDSDGGRKEVNEFSIRYGIPLIDLGCDIQVSDNRVFAGGQVRVVLPGENACLVCCRGFDAGEAALDQMGEEARAEHAAREYVRGADAQATPSVANLNGLTVQYAVSQLLALVHGPQFAQWDYLNFDQTTGRTIPAQTNPLPHCPLCGHTGQLLSGEAATESARPSTTPAKFKREVSKKVPVTASKAKAKADDGIAETPYRRGDEGPA